MAYAALISLAQTIDRILNRDQRYISLQQKQQIISLDRYVILLQAFLENFPEKAKSLERPIADVANEAEDVIEYLTWEQIRHCVEFENHPSVEHTHQLVKVTEKIDSVAGEVMEIKDSFRIEDVQLGGDSSADSSPSRAAPIHEDAMVGLDDDLMAIKTQLCGESSKLEVIPIVGMGGIGKTTLAKNAYHDPLIIERFEICAWVTVSQDYSAQEILSDLLVSMKNFDIERSRQDNDDEKVYKSLKGRRYLIVMDDMWSTKAWDDVRHVFPDDGNGSRIMLTTRLSDVAAYPDSCSRLHEMRLMDADQSWDLLRQKVFKQQRCPPQLENIGKMIARSCRELPLAMS